MPVPLLPLVPLLPVLPVLPVLPLLLPAALLLRGTASIRATVALGMAAGILPAPLEGVCDWGEAAPAMLLWSAPPLLVLPAVPDVPAAAMPPVSLAPAAPVPVVLLLLRLLPLPLAGVPLVSAVALLLVLDGVLFVPAADALLSVAPLRMLLQPASVTASKPASTTLCCFRFMINSFGWYRCSG
jgi:hypothetical protein